MRKFYLLFTGLTLTLMSFQSFGQTATDSCTADFERIQSSNTNPLLAYYRALPWHNNNKKPEQICWNFGDNHDTCIYYDPTISNNYVVSHQYANPGVYNVCVRIRYQGGCISEKCRPVQVGTPDSCSANFESQNSTSTPLGKYFVAQPWNNHNKKPVRICWNFGDNHDTCIFYSTTYTGGYGVYHHYGQPGFYNVCVNILYDGGCEAHLCKTTQVGEPDSCRADFERIPTATANNPLRVYYRALPWNNHDKKPSRICWQFGDGRDTCINYTDGYTGQYVVAHNYEHAGVYEVCVKINYFGGCEARKCRVVTVMGLYDSCRVHIFELAPSITSLTRGFYFTQSNLSGTPKRICWNFGDGTDTCIMVDSNATNVPYSITHTYPGPGVYQACVNVKFWSGCEAHDCKEVVIRTLTDICGGYYTDSLINPHSYLFRGFSIHRPNDQVTGWHWTFGDGSSGVGQQVTHNYNAPGVYRVCLLINTQSGCETRICNSVVVAGTTQSSLILSPNPVVNYLHALFYSTHNEVVNIRIVNSNGIVVRTYTRNAVVGANNWDFLDVATLNTGIYSFIVQSPNQFASSIFFKQ